MPTDSERSLAIFVDFDNIAQGFRRTDRFDIQRVLKRMVEKGKIVAKKTYADWSRYLQYTASLHEAAFELVEIPKRSQTGKNSADIRLCVDAMDLAYNKTHIDTFVIVSGDSDFTPLVSKLKEMGKHVIGMGMTNSTSDLLRDNCDEFIYYEDLEVEKAESPKVNLPGQDTKRKALELLLEACTALRRENKEVLWASMIKETMKRKKPSFNETYHGYNTFSMLLEDAQAQNLVELERDQKRGTYLVTRFGEELTGVVAKPHKGGRPPREPREAMVSKPPLRTSVPKGRHTMPARPEPEATTERAAPAGWLSENELKPREQRVHSFADFAEETSEFLGPRKARTFEDDFGPMTSFRPAHSSTGDEVMANFNRKPVEKPAEPEFSEPVPEPTEESAEQDRRKKRGRGKGRKDRPQTDEAASEPVVPVEVDQRPISFDDVPFTATPAEPVNEAEEDLPAFHTEPPVEPAPRRSKPVRPQPVDPEPMFSATPNEPPPPVEAPKPTEQPRGFGFGIFDE
jgi:uncharacterized protein (TIGR00288 family)